ncbi:MAG TPA: hypothetical protein VHZ03_42355 [Trebonia sp.]|nr:hypothetical protein [Trebonia sp.]
MDENLPQWIDTARTAGLAGIASFAKGLEQDLDVVTSGLTMNWSSGPVEGRVTVKMIKRQMFGRAGLTAPAPQTSPAHRRASAASAAVDRRHA